MFKALRRADKSRSRHHKWYLLQTQQNDYKVVRFIITTYQFAYSNVGF
ncbi:hypothetical protein T12_2626 [Trichinella patagoniensis]|uniref:Uncharacterized protein n=1 Tax=Trichinella patagoniensis TaxID=990121 RepID=A0A0V0YZQ6_9BILA|nr:hypothetical protein T12_2626 [Trichinella patagoniensis]